MPRHDSCECSASLNLLYRDRVLGTDVVLEGDLNGRTRLTLVSFVPTDSQTIESFDYSDDWQVECSECGDEIYANLA